MPGLQNSNRTKAMFAKIGIEPPVLKDSRNEKRKLRDRNERFDDAASYTGSEFQVLNPDFAAAAIATSAQRKCESWLQNKPYKDSSLDSVTPPQKESKACGLPFISLHNSFKHNGCS
ncbi:uncharacterized protein LOC113213777 [Frankliniella occidentalis]|uniref:Uncharacterized protein LOC113213777 n=1 Tax=Frankliniella occidentalis TaxID=133901 RepID=A0A9C6X2D3_FRAOC|nr:uncharacterized protein LOC113213777 [Frankliniella occidentalis]